MERIELKYGQKVLFPAHPITYVIPGTGIAIQSFGRDDKPEKTEFIIEKYWDNDTDPNIYKVKLIPVERTRFGNETLYSSDLKQLINQGTAQLL